MRWGCRICRTSRWWSTMTNNARDGHRILDSSGASGSSGATDRRSERIVGRAELELVSQDFEERNLHELRQTVTAHAATVLTDERVDDMALIAIELASNAIRHGGGSGRLRLWTTPDAIYCQVTDDGPGFPDSKYPAVQRPEPSASGGRGPVARAPFLRRTDRRQRRRRRRDRDGNDRHRRPYVTAEALIEPSSAALSGLRGVVRQPLGESAE